MKLVFTKGVLSGQTLEFNLSEVTIGRDDGNVLRLRTVGVSRVHAVLKRKAEGGWAIYDQNSTNGVKVNGRVIAGESPVFDHDLVTIAEQEFQLEDLGAGISKIEFQPIIVSNPEPPGALRQAEAAPGTTAQSPVDPEKKSPAPSEGEHLLEQLRSAGNSLFDKSGNRQNNEKDPAKRPEKPKSGKPNRVRKLIFISLIVALLGLLTNVLQRSFRRTPQPAAAENAVAAGADFSFYYERVDYDAKRKTAYRLEVLLENNTLICTLDDLYSQRHARLVEERVLEQYANEIDLLARMLTKADFQSLASRPPAVPPPPGNYSRIVIVSGGEAADLKYPGDAIPQAYENAVAAIVDFLEKFGFSTITLSREEMERKGNEHFEIASEAVENYVGNLANLRKAFLNYRAAITCFEQFYPPHARLKIARKKLQEVTALRKAKLKELQEEFSRCSRLNDTAGMSRVCQDIMSLTGERSQAYREASRQLLRLRHLEKKGSRR